MYILGISQPITTSHGFVLNASNNNIVNDSIATNNTGVGFGLWFSNENTLTNNTATHNLHGFYLQESEHNNLVDNDAINKHR